MAAKAFLLRTSLATGWTSYLDNEQFGCILYAFVFSGWSEKEFSPHFTIIFTLFPPILMMTVVPDERCLVMSVASLGVVAEPMNLPSME